MGREVRRVPPSWEHPKDQNGRYKPLFDGYTDRLERWDREKADWDAGNRHDYAEGFAGTYEEWDGERPDPADYMPDWPDEERTHYQMYEDTSEGTPISPVMSNPEELARWLADNGASSFAGMTATYEQWLRVCNGGHAPSAVIAGGRLMSGVEAFTGPTPSDPSALSRTGPTPADPGGST